MKRPLHVWALDLFVLLGFVSMVLYFVLVVAERMGLLHAEGH